LWVCAHAKGLAKTDNKASMALCATPRQAVNSNQATRVVISLILSTLRYFPIVKKLRVCPIAGLPPMHNETAAQKVHIGCVKRMRGHAKSVTECRKSMIFIGFIKNMR
jgi:hypothetical protein